MDIKGVTEQVILKPYALTALTIQNYLPAQMINTDFNVCLLLCYVLFL